MRRRLLLLALVLVVALAAFVVWALYFTIPKPAIASNVGAPALDFTVPDQDGHPFTLSSLRGAPVVLIFYRGYW